MVITRLRNLNRWRTYVNIIARVVEEISPDAEVYLIGGAAENRLMVLSDIDILIALPHEPSREEALRLKTLIFEKAEEQGLPPYAPIELHITSFKTLHRYRGLKLGLSK